MIRLSLFLVFVSLASLASAEVWYEGVIVLKDDQVRQGELIVQANFDVVVFRSGEEVTVYPAHKVGSVFFYDHTADINRRFLSLEVTQEYGFVMHQLYEVVVKGEISVIRRHKGLLFDDHSDAVSFAYFVLYNDQIISLRQFRRRVYPELMDFNQSTIRAFMLRESLNPSKQGDAIRLIEFINDLMRSSVPHLAQIR